MFYKFVFCFAFVLMISACGGSSSSGGSGGDNSSPPVFPTKALLGESLFSDVNLSLNRTQSCATCHNPERAFIDDRLDSNGQIGATSLGDDNLSFGDRNTPTVSYVALIPEFEMGSHARLNSQQPDYVGFQGGQFLDGRQSTLAGQATEPPLNLVEMGMPDQLSVVNRLLENPDYEESFEFLYGDLIFEDTEDAYAAMAESIGLFQEGEALLTFDSKYDLFLRGEYTYDPLSKAALGKALFFSQQFTNCATCHQLLPNSSDLETFTSYEYHNIGVPQNTAARTLNDQDINFVDEGLLNNSQVVDLIHRGKFKTPTLRNVAVTEPYMHNGVFRELRTVIEFYDHFLTNSDNTINRETTLPWRDPEVGDTVAFTELQDGGKLSVDDVEGLVCFLRTLTDSRYEPLIPENSIVCDI